MRSDYVGNSGLLLLSNMCMIYQFIMFVYRALCFLSTRVWMTLKATCDVPELCLRVDCR